MSAASARQPAFAALRQRGYGGYVLGNATAMLADNTEHVITYWVIFQKFHSPALAGFAVLSHWVPFLLLSGYSGALADRYNPRRMIQIGMLVFMGVSLSWALLFMGGHIQTWHAWVLLSLHGIAGVLWTPPAQVLIHEIVGPEHLQSAVRIGATSRYLGTLLGPAFGSALLLLLGPAPGLFVNALVYLPMLWWLHRRRYGDSQGHAAARPPAPGGGLQAVLTTWRSLSGNRPIMAMTLLSGAAAACIGTAYQAQMPGFAHDLGHGNPGIAYGSLLAADAAGALAAGILLESRSLLPASPRTALLLGMLWCLAIGGFALAPSYAVALPLLLAAGFLELAFNAMSQTIVQLNAPPAQRGRIIGLFITASLGLRAVSGITVGFGGALLGIHASLAASAAGLLVCVLLIARWLRQAPDGSPAAAG